jgi:RsiW-degrading membrane proteinase PrsW (M82 family)
MTYPLYIFFGVLPSIIWLLFYLRRDVHPEPKSEVLKIFFYGALATIPAFFLEKGVYAFTASSLFSDRVPALAGAPFFITIFNIFIGVALVEEILKYLVVREKALRSAEFDEPIDALLYMIIAALGFAALENILILFRLGPEFLVKEALALSIFRFLGATFLHTLCSGTVGFFLALSFFETKKRFQLLSTGLGLATLLHGLYNFSIMKMEGNLRVLIPIIILLGLAIFVSLGFKRLKKLKSVCKI